MGEFLMLVENHAGQAGPRWELSEVLERLERLRRLQRKLGYAEDELTYLYVPRLVRASSPPTQAHQSPA